ncbi:uroporphyrinogen-III synthase [Saccharolobus solfataricus]|uniref:Uroporphyrinogen-III synthase n=3 Tax=Saccharolobus solfataricus TaxID=2287 RepID=Q980U3_SACS2|nr:uroporphyrinogen-III synthase [Saccharolobus solfataricus]AAK40530.1 Uroporphyrinogen III synthase, putative [Saccharolobus solfataricus P2]AKA73510.1 uroporphyrinogen-III synthase [Saccharolobus solfataricus]AKA76208.1 uroporphyrinogen-III synthase [Saccharolobus solfataricus]AKA78900.1 uroporphyrinogen-III synthase [Saccharolobus solfataricus]AZF67979.1 uroporphyrinogen-III synthase [Saccharolobus solfataricus]
MRVLFLRPDNEDNELNEKLMILRKNGIEVLNIPIFKIKCVSYSLPTYDYEALAFTSRNSVICFKDRTLIKNVHKIYAIGEETAELLMKMYNVNPITPERFTSIELAKRILEDKVNSILSIRSRKASEDMRNILNGKIKYDEIYVYDSEIIRDNINEISKILTECEVDAIAFTSSLMAKLIGPFIRGKCNIIIFSIGPMTTETLKRVNNKVKIIESKTHSIKGIIETILVEMKRNGRD